MADLCRKQRTSIEVGKRSRQPSDELFSTSCADADQEMATNLGKLQLLNFFSPYFLHWWPS
jgi:hypothetical protein